MRGLSQRRLAPNVSEPVVLGSTGVPRFRKNTYTENALLSADESPLSGRNSGKHLLALSFSAFDPTRTLACI